VKSTTCSGLHATPDSFRLNQNPLAAYRLRQAPVLIAVLRYRSRFMVGQVRLEFPRLFTDFRPVCFPLTGVLTVGTGLTTLLSIALRRCRPTASSVWMQPLSLQAGQYSPGPQLELRFLSSAPALAGGPFA